MIKKTWKRPAAPDLRRVARKFAVKYVVKSDRVGLRRASPSATSRALRQTRSQRVS